MADWIRKQAGNKKINHKPYDDLQGDRALNKTVFNEEEGSFRFGKKQFVIRYKFNIRKHVLICSCNFSHFPKRYLVIFRSFIISIVVRFLEKFLEGEVTVFGKRFINALQIGFGKIINIRFFFGRYKMLLNIKKPGESFYIIKYRITSY